MGTKQKKINRPKAINPKGFKDCFGAELLARQNMLNAIIEIYYKYGFDPLETPAVETVEALGEFLPDVDRPNQGVFSWNDSEDNWLALRYDLTAPLARVYAQFRNQLPSPYRRYSMGPVWRNEKPGPGRFKQFYQCDADSVGVSNFYADAEVCMMMSDILEHVGVYENSYIVKLNNRKILNGVLERAGLLDINSVKDNESKRGVVLRAIDKFDRLGESGVRDLLGAGRKDQSGDFSKGAGLTQLQSDMIIAFLKAKGPTPSSTCLKLRDLVSGSEIGISGIEELEKICEIVFAAGYKENKICIDPSIVRGLGYYTGPVFEAELTFALGNEKGFNQQIGSVAGGGRYDGLIKRFTGQEVPATGLSIGVDRLLSALNYLKKEKSETIGPILVTVMDKNLLGDYQAIVQELRKADLRAEMYVGNPKDFGKQLKYADLRRSPLAIILGSEEASRGVVQVKDLKLGSELSKSIRTNEEWKARPSQFEVKRTHLLMEIHKILGR